MHATLPSSGRFAEGKLRLPAAAAMAVAVIVSAAGCGSASADAQTGQVVRIIDGDTLVINFENEDQTVRLLNVDTPETKHPDKSVECLGPEATAFLESIVPPGTEVGLDFDVERTDQYDRVLAAVALENGTLVNSEIARQGLGIAVLYEPNSKYYDAVREAQAEATSSEAGLYDPTTECTIPAEIQAVSDAVTEAMAQPAGETAAAAAVTVGTLAAAITSAKSLHAALKAGEKSVRWLAYSTAASVSLLSGLSSTITSGEDRLKVVRAEVGSLKSSEAQEEAEQARAAAEQEAQAEAAAAAERERQEAAQQAEADRLAAESAAIEAERLAAAERERLRNLPAPYVPPAPQPNVPPAPQPAPPIVQAPPAVQEPLPGYTGPRCYAPGGKTWTPCP